jgi:AbrB family looped-hinge helix DNA binding protein
VDDLVDGDVPALEEQRWRGREPVQGGSGAGVRAVHRCVDPLEFARNPYYSLFGKDEGASMSAESKLTAKGQTTIPKLIRDSLGMKTGDKMSFTLMPNGIVIMRLKNKRISDLAGLLHKKGRRPVPIELLSR